MNRRKRVLYPLRRLRPRLSYANVVASLALFGVLGGGAYATHTHRMGTQDLQNRAVTAPKLANGAVVARAIGQNAVRAGKVRARAVRPRHLANNAVRGRAIARGVPGVIAAGANIHSNGEIARWFNRFGGRPEVTHQSTGSYGITFPGLEGRVHGAEAVALVSLRTDAGTIRRGSTGGNARVFTTDTGGDPANRGFDIVVVLPGPPG